jgi:TRAP transporter TAXI family solute receptor
MRMRIGRLVALAAMAFAFATVAWAAGPEVDPASVSEGLKAIFKYGKGQRETVDRLNANTVTLMSGTIGGTYVQFGADLASALDDGDNLRVLSIIGRGSVQSVADILFLKGVDLGIVRSDTLDYLEKKGYANNIKKQFTYITKLYNEEMHVVAPKTIRTLSDLEGKTVAVDLPNGGTFVTSAIVFERLGIKANFAYIEQRLAYERLKKGEIDAMIAVQGKPSKFTTSIKDPDLHLVPVDYAKSLQPDYLPAVLTSDDYPNLIEPGGRIDTIAAPAVLATTGRPTPSAIANWSGSWTHSSAISPCFRSRHSIRSGKRWRSTRRYPVGHGFARRRNGSTASTALGWRPPKALEWRAPTCGACSNSS